MSSKNKTNKQKPDTVGVGQQHLHGICRAHLGCENSHQQGLDGVPEPPTDRGGPGHCGVATSPV